VAWHEGARIIRQALASTPGTRVRLEPLGQQTRRRNDVQVITIVGSQATGLANAEYDLTVVSLASKDARSTSLPEQDNNPSRLVNKYLDSVADHKIREYATEDKRAPRLRGRRAWESGRQNSARECRFQERLSPVTYVTHTYGKWFRPGRWGPCCAA
jgi:hypothetical protein